MYLFFLIGSVVLYCFTKKNVNVQSLTGDQKSSIIDCYQKNREWGSKDPYEWVKFGKAQIGSVDSVWTSQSFGKHESVGPVIDMNGTEITR